MLCSVMSHVSRPRGLAVSYVQRGHVFQSRSPVKNAMSSRTLNSNCHGGNVLTRSPPSGSSSIAPKVSQSLGLWASRASSPFRKPRQSHQHHYSHLPPHLPSPPGPLTNKHISTDPYPPCAKQRLPAGGGHLTLSFDKSLSFAAHFSIRAFANLSASVICPTSYNNPNRC